MNKTVIILSAIIVILAVALVGVLLYLGGQSEPERGVPPLTEISPMDPDSANWGVNFPNQLSTLQQTETNNTRTAFGGSQPPPTASVSRQARQISLVWSLLPSSYTARL